MFALWQVVLTALVALLVSLIVLRWRFKGFELVEVGSITLIVGLSVFGWRISANVPVLNADPAFIFSPNDLLCPVITYVCLSLYAAFRTSRQASRWEQARSLLTLVSFIVNVVVI